MSKAATIPPSFQLDQERVYDILVNDIDPPEGDWDFTIFYGEVKKLVLWDVKRKVSEDKWNNDVWKELLFRDLFDPSGAIFKACKEKFDGGADPKALYEHIKLSILFS